MPNRISASVSVSVARALAGKLEPRRETRLMDARDILASGVANAVGARRQSEPSAVRFAMGWQVEVANAKLGSEERASMRGRAGPALRP